LKPNRLGTSFDGIICDRAGICTRYKKVHDVDALRLGNVEQRGVRALVVGSLLAGVDRDDNAAVIQECARNAERRAFGI
jgi:hypothetical protein